MIQHKFPDDEGILLPEPTTPLQKDDFDVRSGFADRHTTKNDRQKTNTLDMMISTGRLNG